MRKILGITALSLPFGIIVAFGVMAGGWVTTLASLGFAGIVLSLVILGLWLLEEK